MHSESRNLDTSTTQKESNNIKINNNKLSGICCNYFRDKTSTKEGKTKNKTQEKGQNIKGKFTPVKGGGCGGGEGDGVLAAGASQTKGPLTSHPETKKARGRPTHQTKHFSMANSVQLCK